jgi:hypothetical protein
MTTESYTTSFHSEDEVSGGTEVRFTHRRLIPLTECFEARSGRQEALHLRPGPPLSGGYAGAKATQRFMAGYAQTESLRSGLQISFATVLPSITPLTGVGRPAVRAYAKRNGVSEEQYMEQMGEPLTPQVAGEAIVDLVRKDQATLAAGYFLTGVGLTELPAERDGKGRT